VPAVRDVVLFPTKLHWQNPSQYHWIFEGLAALRKILVRHEPDADLIEIAMPALGCGEGGLDWKVVQGMLEAWKHTLPERYFLTIHKPFNR
jgi:hypothetical protein